MPNDPTLATPPVVHDLHAKPLPRRLPLAGSAPPLVPARMINEALYCERLLYLEWAQGEFADNAFTVEGRVAHKRAVQPGGKLPAAPSQASPTDEAADLPPLVTTRTRRRLHDPSRHHTKLGPSGSPRNGSASLRRST